MTRKSSIPGIEHPRQPESFWFSGSIPEPVVPEFNRGLLASISPGTTQDITPETAGDPALAARPSLLRQLSPHAAPKPVPESEHRNPTLDELESRNSAPLTDGAFRSMLIHSALLMLVLLKSVFLPGKPVLIAPVLRVDLVGLPDHLAKDLKNITEAAPDLKDALKQAEDAAQEQIEREKQAAVEAAKEKAQAGRPEEDDGDAVAIRQREKEQKARKEEERNQAAAEKEQRDKLKKSMAKLKAMSRLEAIKNSERASMEKTDGLENRTGTVIKGNRLSPGTSLDGSAREAAQASYYDRVRDKLVSNWALPPWLARQKHQAQVVIYIDSRGRIREYQFLKASGNDPFDAAVRKTLQDSQPFVPPPGS